MTNDKALNLLGLVYRAGKTICGAAAAERLSTQNRIKVIRTYSKEELGRALGRSQTAIVVLTDKGFAEAVSKAVQKMD